jgi:hypothetical protein
MFPKFLSRFMAPTVGLIIAGSLILSACSGSDQPVTAAQTPQVEIQEQEIPTPESTSTEPSSQVTPTQPGDPLPLDEQGEQGDDQANSSAQESGDPEPEQISPPSPKSNLAATDPSSVELSSGSPQLVEFFAFW